MTAYLFFVDPTFDAKPIAEALSALGIPWANYIPGAWMLVDKDLTRTLDDMLAILSPLMDDDVAFFLTPSTPHFRARFGAPGPEWFDEYWPSPRTDPDAPQTPRKAIGQTISALDRTCALLASEDGGAREVAVSLLKESMHMLDLVVRDVSEPPPVDDPSKGPLDADGYPVLPGERLVIRNAEGLIVGFKRDRRFRSRP